MMLVSVITPCRNEAAFIGPFVNGVMKQLRDGFEIELLVADGMSDDGTRAILDDLVSTYRNLSIIENPGKIVSTGLNQCIEHASGEIVVRMDVHTRYAEDYVLRCVEVLSGGDAACVGGAWRAEGTPVLQQAIADAFQSPIGSGGAHSRNFDYEGPCDTVYLGCWRREVLIGIGGFDEQLVRNQDDELALRLSLAGTHIWQSPKIRSFYRPRASLRALYRQFFQYGYWKVAVARKHGLHASWRHVVPVIFMATLAVLIIATLISPWGLVALLAVCGLYVSVILLASRKANSQPGLTGVATVAAAMATMHFGYGLGYGLGLKDFRLSSSARRASMTTITR